MRILIVSQYFWPENFRLNDLALGLKERGHDVVVLTAKPNYPTGTFFPGYGFFRPWRESFEGIQVCRVPIVPRGKGKGLNLVVNYLSFVLSGLLFGPWMCRGRFDVIYALNASPITAVLPAIFLRALKRVPMQMQILDLWPESLAAVGAVRPGIGMRMVDAMVRFIYRRCDQILIQSRGFLASVTARGGDAARIEYFPTTAESLFSQGVNESAAAAPVAVPGKFKILFAGNVGEAQDFETILDAAERTMDNLDITWVVLGDGRRSDWVRTEIQRRGLRNVHLLGRHPLESMPAFFSQADVLLVTLRRDPVFALTIPGKLQSYLAFGKPVVAALDGEGARVVRESGAGIACPASDPVALAQAARDLYALPENARSALGECGRRYFAEHFEREMLIDRLTRWMVDLAGAGRMITRKTESQL